MSNSFNRTIRIFRKRIGKKGVGKVLNSVIEPLSDLVRRLHECPLHWPVSVFPVDVQFSPWQWNATLWNGSVILERPPPMSPVSGSGWLGRTCVCQT